MSALRALPGPQRGEPRGFLPVLWPGGRARAFRWPRPACGRRLPDPLALLDPAGAGHGLPGLAGCPRRGPAAVISGLPAVDQTGWPGRGRVLPVVRPVGAPRVRTRCCGR